MLFMNKCSNGIILLIVHVVMANAHSGPRIIGGDVVTNRSKFAYQVLLTYADKPFCGGSIITDKHILTAAHCLKRMPSRHLRVVVGNLKAHDDPNEVKKSIARIYIHQDYKNYGTLYNDIAILLIKGNFSTWTKFVRPIMLATIEPKKNEECIVSGWGAILNESSHTVEDLREVQVPIIERKVCKNIYKQISDEHICAGTIGKDACVGDSGGPLVCNNSQVGIVSFGLDCGEAWGGVYTNVAYFLDWILAVENVGFCSKKPSVSLFICISIVIYTI